MSAVDFSGTIALGAIGLLTANRLLGLLLSVGYNPTRPWPRQRVKLQNRPVDFIDAEKVYVELCAAGVAAASAWRYRHRRAMRHSHVK